MSELRDIKNNIETDLAFYRQFTANGSWNGYILDTAHYESGIMFSFAVIDYTDGTYTVTIQESDDSGMSGATTVTSNNVIGSLSDLIFTADTGVPMVTIGIIGTKRYVRLKILLTGQTVPNTKMTVNTSKIPEYKPVV
jgi:hypothetical protein